MENKALAEAIQKAVIETDGRVTLSCQACFQIAKELNVEMKDISRYCNQNKIKLVQCQLGCFK